MVLVFKTSVQNKAEVAGLAPALNYLLNKRGIWNFDLEDCDHILRIESSSLQCEEIIRLMNGQGFFCAELEDTVVLNAVEQSMAAAYS
ncbi:hypothetical protein [Cesiribacter sp. SM1]|uniref:hypothetical protein n=1 Tax=Cesiribacter sp. SM1 TaxID=2861196 RepID=UPI001CD1DBD6|nr:hypothetical protein [Cesiribacter sp. SM1]